MCGGMVKMENCSMFSDIFILLNFACTKNNTDKRKLDKGQED